MFKLFQKQKLNKSQIACTHCKKNPIEKLKKCEDCYTRNICRTCYKDEDLTVCKPCEDEYERWM